MFSEIVETRPQCLEQISVNSSRDCVFSGNTKGCLLFHVLCFGCMTSDILNNSSLNPRYLKMKLGRVKRLTSQYITFKKKKPYFGMKSI